MRYTSACRFWHLWLVIWLAAITAGMLSLLLVLFRFLLTCLNTAPSELAAAQRSSHWECFKHIRYIQTLQFIASIQAAPAATRFHSHMLVHPSSVAGQCTSTPIGGSRSQCKEHGRQYHEVVIYMLYMQDDVVQRRQPLSSAGDTYLGKLLVDSELATPTYRFSVRCMTQCTLYPALATSRRGMHMQPHNMSQSDCACLQSASLNKSCIQ